MFFLFFLRAHVVLIRPVPLSSIEHPRLKCSPLALLVYALAAHATQRHEVIEKDAPRGGFSLRVALPHVYILPSSCRNFITDHKAIRELIEKSPPKSSKLCPIECICGDFIWDYIDGIAWYAACRSALCVSSCCVFHRAVCFIALCVSSRCVFHRAVCFIALCVSSCCVFHRAVCFIARCASSFHLVYLAHQTKHAQAQEHPYDKSQRLQTMFAQTLTMDVYICV